MCLFAVCVCPYGHEYICVDKGIAAYIDPLIHTQMVTRIPLSLLCILDKLLGFAVSLSCQMHSYIYIAVRKKWQRMCRSWWKEKCSPTLKVRGLEGETPEPVAMEEDEHLTDFFIPLLTPEGLKRLQRLRTWPQVRTAANLLSLSENNRIVLLCY